MPAGGPSPDSVLRPGSPIRRLEAKATRPGARDSDAIAAKVADDLSQPDSCDSIGRVLRRPICRSQAGPGPGRPACRSGHGGWNQVNPSRENQRGRAAGDHHSLSRAFLSQFGPRPLSLVVTARTVSGPAAAGLLARSRPDVRFRPLCQWAMPPAPPA